MPEGEIPFSDDEIVYDIRLSTSVKKPINSIMGQFEAIGFFKDYLDVSTRSKAIKENKYNIKRTESETTILPDGNGGFKEVKKVVVYITVND